MDLSIRLRRPDDARSDRVTEPQQSAHEREGSQSKNAPAEEVRDDRG